MSAALQAWLWRAQLRAQPGRLAAAAASIAIGVALALAIHLVNRSALDEARRLLADVGLASRAAAMPRELSGGEQQRVALARALVHRPALVLADEPTGNLDPATASTVLALIAERVRASGATLLMVTHSEQAASIADRRWRLDAGGLHEA